MTMSLPSTNWDVLLEWNNCEIDRSLDLNFLKATLIISSRHISVTSYDYKYGFLQSFMLSLIRFFFMMLNTDYIGE